MVWKDTDAWLPNLNESISLDKTRGRIVQLDFKVVVSDVQGLLDDNGFIGHIGKVSNGGNNRQ